MIRKSLITLCNLKKLSIFNFFLNFFALFTFLYNLIIILFNYNQRFIGLSENLLYMFLDFE